MAQRSRKIFTIFLLVVLCIATVAMPFAYATVSDPDDPAVRDYYAVLPFETLKVEYLDGHIAYYPLPVKFSFPSSTNSYQIILEDVSNPSGYYDIIVEFYLQSTDLSGLGYTYSAFANCGLSSESGSLAGATITFELRSYTFFPKNLNWRVSRLISLNSTPDPRVLNISNYTVDFDYYYFDRDINDLTTVNKQLNPGLDLFVDLINYPAVGDNPAIWTYRFCPYLPSNTLFDNVLSAGNGIVIKGSISAQLSEGYFGWRMVYLGVDPDTLSVASYIDRQLIPLFPNSNDFTTWLSDGVFGFLSFEIIPGLSLWMIFATLVAIPLVVMFLKLFAGG